MPLDIIHFTLYSYLMDIHVSHREPTMKTLVRKQNVLGGYELWYRVEGTTYFDIFFVEVA